MNENFNVVSSLVFVYILFYIPYENFSLKHSSRTSNTNFDPCMAPRDKAARVSLSYGTYIFKVIPKRPLTFTSNNRCLVKSFPMLNDPGSAEI